MAQLQKEKLQKMRQKKKVDFEHNLTNMLIHLYNGKQCFEYIKEYKTILDCVSLIIFSRFIAFMDEKVLWAAL